MLCLTSNLLVVRALLDAGADIDVRDSRGRTPLMLAVMPSGGHHPLTELLVEAGADLTLRTRDGETIVQCAGMGVSSALEAQQSSGLAEHLRAHGAE